MGISTGYGRAITSGSVFAFDTADVINSYKGEPTTNLVPDASNMSGWSSYDNGNDGTFITEFGTVGYKMYNRGSWNGVYRGISLPSTGTYTVSAYFRYLGGASDNNGGQVYTNGGGIGDTSTGHSKVVGEWVRVSMTRTYTTTSINFYLISYGGTYNGSYSSWEVTMPQIELKSHATPFVNGTRSTTQGLVPLTSNSSIDLTNTSFDSNAQLAFDGTNDYVSVTLPSSISVYCLEMVWYNNNAIPNNDTVIGGPSTYQTPIEFNGTGQGVHLGAWTGGFTNEAIHIWGSGGATANQVYAGVGYHHVVFNWNGTTYDIWVDGVNTVTQYLSGYNYAQLITATSIKLGNDVSGYCFNGQIPVTKIYNRALSEGEVKQNYNKYKTRFNLEGNSQLSPALSAQALYDAGYRTDGMYWLKPTGAPVAFSAYIDFTTANGPWVHVGTAVGNTRGLYTYQSTWAQGFTDSGNIANPYDTNTSNFNANSFIYCKGNNIMIKYSTTGYTQASGFSNESWRDVYSFLNGLTAWPTQPSYNRALPITARGGVVTGPTVTGAGLIYGSNWNNTGNYDNLYVYGFDSGGDTYAYLSTGTYNAGGVQSEADHGIGANENGPSVSTFPGNDYALDTSTAFDAGTNDTLDSGAATAYNNTPFSLWIKN